MYLHYMELYAAIWSQDWIHRVKNQNFTASTCLKKSLKGQASVRNTDKQNVPHEVSVLWNLWLLYFKKQTLYNTCVLIEGSMKLYALGGSSCFLSKEKSTKFEIYGQGVVVTKSYLDTCSDKLQKTRRLKNILVPFLFAKVKKMLPYGGAFAVHRSASGIHVDPKVAHGQGDLGCGFTSFCVD